MTMRQSTRGLRRLCVGLLFLAGCNAADVTAPRSRGPATVLEVIPASAYLVPGAQLTLRAEVLDRRNQPMDVGPAEWTSSASQVATVGADGRITAQGPGTAVISATVPGRRSQMTVTVAAGSPLVSSWTVVSEGSNDVSLLGVWMATASEGWAVGPLGTILHTVDGGATWTREPFSSQQTLVGIWGTDRSNVYAVGTAGTVLRYDGSTWSPISVPSGGTLLNVWGLDADNVFIVGASVVLRWNGVSWQQMPREGPMELWSVWGSSLSDLHAVGQNGVIVRWDGTMWRQVPSPFSELLLGVWGTSPSNAWAVGIQGTILRWNGTSWSHASSPTGGSLFGLWGRSADEIYAVGNNGLMLRWNGAAWTVVPHFTTGQNLRAVHGAASGGTVAVGWAGTLIRSASGTEAWLPGPSAPVLFDVAGDLAVGAGGAVLRRMGGAMVPEPVANSRDLHSVVREGEGYLAVGDSGTILRRAAGGAWSLIPSGTLLALRAIWTPDDGGPATIVGSNGLVLVARGDSWVIEPSPTVQYLRWTFGLHGGDRFAVGDEGVVIRNQGEGWMRMITPSTARLRAVWGSGPDNLFAAGDNGIVLRFDGVRWYRLTPPLDVEWRSIWGTGPSDVYFAGDRGVVLHYDGAAWRQVSTPTDLIIVSLRPGVAPGTLQGVGERAVVLEGRY
jgi:photosystem II stability/assembly factor-like uncharacterized protein